MIDTSNLTPNLATIALLIAQRAPLGAHRCELYGKVKLDDGNIDICPNLDIQTRNSHVAKMKKL